MLRVYECFDENVFRQFRLISQKFVAKFLKTRSEDVAVAKFFDEPMLAELARQESELQQYF